ncbi:MAG TPA: AI-2E family transporter [Atribacterota bacterium]|nr:AI-2E family transporter [Atribacterota bacterium]
MLLYYIFSYSYITGFYELNKIDTFSNFILGQFKEAVILGTLCTIGMTILRLPYPTTIGSVVGLSSVIPMVGSYIGATFGILLIIVVDWVSAVFFLVFIIILQQIESNFIYPKIVGDSIGLPGIWVFAAIIIGSGLMGFLGILLGVPIAATIYKLLNHY